MAIRTLVTGAAGFIGQHLVPYLVAQGHTVVGADIRTPDERAVATGEYVQVDLRSWDSCRRVTEEVDEVYHLAANLGGIGYIEENKAVIVRDNLLIDTHLIEACRINRVPKLLFASSACVYPTSRQSEAHADPIAESETYPADPEDGYGWQKLTTERLCRHYRDDFGLKTYIARLHNIFGPLSAWSGGREKSPAAVCRRIALAEDGDEIEVWGDGKQRRSYCYVDDCVRALFLLMGSTYHEPVNIGQDRSVSIDDLVAIVAGIAGKSVRIRHNPSMPQGVRGRNANIELMRRIFGWEPLVSLETGLEYTYRWVSGECERLAH